MKRSIKVLIIALGSVLALLLLAVGYVLLSFAWTKSHQISEASVARMCQDFYADVQSQITHVPGYTIDKSAKRCAPEVDEAGFTDYVLQVDFKVSNGAANASSQGRQALDALAGKLPRKGYPVEIVNMQNGESSLCVSASRYIDNDGKDVPQGGANGPHATYVEPGSIKDFAPCEDL